MIDIIREIHNIAFAKKFNFSKSGPIAKGKRIIILIINAMVVMKSDKDRK